MESVCDAVNASARNIVGLSVCLSVTVVYCVEIASDNYYQTT